MATHKEQLQALAIELAEEKTASKRARAERDKYKAQVATKGEQIAQFSGHVVLSDSATLDKNWRRATETSNGQFVLRYNDGTVEYFGNRSGAQQRQRHDAYVKSSRTSTIHPTGSSTYVCTFSEGCSEQRFGTVAQGSFTAYAATDEDGKITTITLVAS